MAKKGCTTESKPVIKCFNTTICYFEHYRIQNSRTFLSTFMIFACLVSFDFDWIARWNQRAVWCYGWEKSQSKYLYNLFPASSVYERVSYYHFHEQTSFMFFHDHELYNWKLRAQISQFFFLECFLWDVLLHDKKLTQKFGTSSGTVAVIKASHIP